jgi:predicted GNAT family N-acyltransferase
MVAVRIFGVDDLERMEEALSIRTRVFVDEQGVPPEEEVDAHDRDDGDAVHALAYAVDRPVGAGRFYPLGNDSVRIGRMAVLASERGTGVGAAILAALMRAAADRGFVRAELHAQTHALAFYERAGFVAFGPEFHDAGILHRAMAKPLREQAR